ncbi:unnamed protein product [Brassica rapa subsp. trilocularis]
MDPIRTHLAPTSTISIYCPWKQLGQMLSLSFLWQVSGG